MSGHEEPVITTCSESYPHRIHPAELRPAPRWTQQGLQKPEGQDGVLPTIPQEEKTNKIEERLYPWQHTTMTWATYTCGLCEYRLDF